MWFRIYVVVSYVQMLFFFVSFLRKNYFNIKPIECHVPVPVSVPRKFKLNSNFYGFV